MLKDHIKLVFFYNYYTLAIEGKVRFVWKLYDKAPNVTKSFYGKKRNFI